MKQGIRKVKKLELKPWVFKEMKTSMKLREKLYKETMKKRIAKEKSRNMKLTRSIKKIVDLLKVCKQTHYKKYLE